MFSIDKMLLLTVQFVLLSAISLCSGSFRIVVPGGNGFAPFPISAGIAQGGGGEMKIF